MTSHRRRAGRARHAVRREIEALEPRLVLDATAGAVVAEAAQVALVGRTLTVEGTDGPDRILISPARPPGALRVVVDGVPRVYEGVGSLVVRGGAGNDVVILGGRVTLPVRVEGGAGDDRIRAGSGPGVYLGDDGDDLMVGGGGRPALDGGSGQNRIVLAQALGTIRVGPSASGEALRVLTRGYRGRPLGAGDAAETGPIVVGAADLDDAWVVERLQASYEAGQTVALTDASPEDAERLRLLVGHDSPAGWAADVPRAALVAFREVSVDGARSQSETTVVSPRQVADVVVVPAAFGNRQADQRVLEHLTTVFAASPVVAERPSTSSNLLDLTSSYLSKAVNSNTNGDALQIVNTVYGARSFMNQADFFYVLQEADYHANQQAIHLNFGDITTKLTTPSTNPGILQPSPQTTMSTTSVTSGVSYTIGGSIGFNESQGFNASISGSVTVSNSKTTMYPPISLFNAVNLATGVAQFGYSVQDASQAAGSTLTFYNQWIWQVPFGAYTAGQTSIEFATVSELFESNEVPISPVVTVNLTSKVPTPFGDTFALQQPMVASVSSPAVKEGTTFTIHGSGLYPSLVTAVLIGGQPLPAANYRVVSDTEITVVAPNAPGLNRPVVVQSTQGVSNDNVTISITGPSQVFVQAQPITAVAGQAFTNLRVATFTSSLPNANPADFTATIDWGDGTTSDGSITAAGQETFNILGTHTYATAGTYPFSVQVTDSDGNKTTATGTATVSNADGPQNLVTRPITAVAGQAFTNLRVATFTSSLPNANPADFTATINWGDFTQPVITTVVAAGPGTFDVLGTHTYNVAGTYPFEVQVADRSGRTAKAPGTATVT